ncbi:9044_t:CDS:2 [Diversispora eburnea]|uniref:9044_t:CDS:1 n=1 Tax=Diversispora eburnea TaxID=1213867 RepID=A0A9N9A2E9_9GLOM|nr:9044_t:CDS:2 [Diversispora eburnea]
MLRGAKTSLVKKKNSIKRTLSKDGLKGRLGSLNKGDTRDIAQLVTLEEVHLIIKRCSDEISERGLHEVDIFKPTHIGYHIDEVRDLISCLLRENRADYEDELRAQNIHNIVATMKWALMHSTTALVPYQFYEEFVRYEQEWDYDPSKGSFKKFLCYLPKQNQEILCELFKICVEVTEESDTNNMSVQKIVKSLALCILGDNKNYNRNFNSAYAEWRKCSNACLHLFLAYLREKAINQPLNSRLTILLDNYVEYRKLSVTSDYFEHPLPDSTVKNLSPNNDNNLKSVDFSSIESRPVSILKVTRQVPTTSGLANRQRKFSNLLPDVMDSLKRKTIIRPNTLMSIDEQQSAEKIWTKFQNDGVGALSDDYLNLYLSVEENTRNSMMNEAQWNQFSRKGFKSLYLDLPDVGMIENNTSNEGQEVNLTRNDSGVSMRQTIVWDEFPSAEFEDNVDNNVSSISLPIIEITEAINNYIKKKTKLVKFKSIKKPRSKSLDETLVGNENLEENLKDWDIVDSTQDLPITTHLSIETIDEIFPYVWMETTASEQHDRWGDWVFIEPRKGLVHECEWVMLEEKEQVFSEWEVDKKYLKRRKMKGVSAFSNFSIPWVRGRKGKSRPVSKASTIGSKSREETYWDNEQEHLDDESYIEENQNFNNSEGYIYDIVEEDEIQEQQQNDRNSNSEIITPKIDIKGKGKSVDNYNYNYRPYTTSIQV